MAEFCLNCRAHVPIEKALINSGDNELHCPKTGNWVELKENPEKETLCVGVGCNNRDDENIFPLPQD